MKKVKKFLKRMKEKDFLISAPSLLLAQATIYFLIKYLQSNYHTINFIVDSKIYFIPYFVYFYNLFYPFVFFSLYYIYCKDNETYKKGIYASVIGFLICDVIFLVYPTIMIRTDISNISMDVITRFVLNITYLFDEPALNCLPSIHVLFCLQIMYTTIMCKNIKYKYKLFIIIFGLLIILSTLFIKQHYVYDAIAALIICIFSNLVVFIINKYFKRK